MTAVDDDPGTRRHMLQELGFTVRSEGENLTGTAEILREMLVPGTDHLRTSILAMWTDTLSGLLAARTVAPAVPVTVELDVHLYRPLPSTGPVRAVGRSLRQGRTLSVAEVRFATDDGEPLAVGGGSFVTSPDPSVRLPSNLSIGEDPPIGARLTMPLAERAGCERRSPGVAVLRRSEDGLNSARTVNGGLISLAAEEAVLGLAPGRTLCSLGLRYLHPVRVGPVVAEATQLGDLARVELR
ncbi:MAG TPA: hotdog domain-containing protein, partial [Acidimicrobiales bacterium]|nr:hotdog domain-containing protein [Acidimicrobiales bacterium]